MRLTTYLRHMRESRAARPAMVAWRAMVALVNNDGIEIAGFIAYTGLVALFPFAIFLFALAGYIGRAALAEEIITLLFSYLPREVADTLSPVFREIFTSQQAGLLTLGIVGTLWVASSGVEALRMGLNRAYSLKETRPIWERRGVSVMFVVISAASMLAASALVIAGPLAIAWLAQHSALKLDMLVSAGVLSYALAVLLVILFLCVLYRYLPNGLFTWASVLPGAGATALLWIVLAALFSLYLGHARSYETTYGSLGGVVITLLFLHASAIIFLLGAEINAEWLAERRRLKEENEKPGLQRGKATGHKIKTAGRKA